MLKKIIIAVLILLSLVVLAAAAMYLGIVETPGYIANIPVVGSVLSGEESDSNSDKAVTSLEDQLRKELSTANRTVIELDNDNSELRAKLETVEKERDALKSAVDASNSDRERVQRLASYYSRMKPKQAAVILAEMDDAAIVNILSGMDDDAAALILGQMEPQKAANITRQILRTEGGE